RACRPFAAGPAQARRSYRGEIRGHRGGRRDLIEEHGDRRAARAVAQRSDPNDPAREPTVVKHGPRPNRYRDAWCGQLTAERAGTQARVAGWVHRRRDHGGLIFIDLRDRAGLVQLVFHPETSPEAHQAAHALRSEDVLTAVGTVVRREAQNVNPNIATGEIELSVTELEILDDAATPPFPVDEDVAVDESLRLMIGGMERYYQIVRCFRDEDARADRLPEFTQLDIEMAFVDEDDVIDTSEAAMGAVFEREGFDVPAPPWPRMTFAEAV